MAIPNVLPGKSVFISKDKVGKLLSLFLCVQFVLHYPENLITNQT